MPIAVSIISRRRVGMERNMRAFLSALGMLSLLILVSPARAQTRTFGDFDCTIDCSGHSAGYKWAEQHSIGDEGDCPYGNSRSFHEGCIAYTRDNRKILIQMMTGTR
jgi:hypothetical protein